MKLNSQLHQAGKVDWRAIPAGQMSIEPYILPHSLEEQIRSFMHKMGLVFGSFDFVVSEDHDYIFLEVNEQGQFLWMEDCSADFKMLDTFVQFLLNQSRKFKWAPEKSVHSIDKYKHQMAGLVSQNMRRHVALNNAKTYNA